MRTNYTTQGGYSTPLNKLKYDVTLHVCYFELSSFEKGAAKKKKKDKFHWQERNAFLCLLKEQKASSH